MAKNEINDKIELNYIRRYSPQGIFADGTGFSKQSTIVQHKDKYTKHESITDKESYRLNLSSARGAISSLSPEQQKGLYLFPDGKYSKDKDISYILRKDLSIVEMEEYITRCKENLEIADSELTQYLKTNIEKLEEKQAAAIAQQTKQSSNNSASSE